jgi:hypothetical protein
MQLLSLVTYTHIMGRMCTNARRKLRDTVEQRKCADMHLHMLK